MNSIRATGFAALALAAVLVATAALPGCGSKVALDFNTSSNVPVVTYYARKAIAPVYNPDAPVAIVYGDGTLVKKDDSYKFTTGTLEEEVSLMLTELQNDGFFNLNPEYKGEPLAGGTTEQMIVALTAKTYYVTVESGAAPANWDEMVKLVTDARITGAREYIPPVVWLLANVATDVPAGANVQPWPGNPQDLEKASAMLDGTDKRGVTLEGEAATTAWLAIQQTFDTSGGSDAYWSADGNTYTYVYAVPLFPGVHWRE